MRNIKTQELVQPLIVRQVDFKRPLYLIAFGCVHKGSENHASSDWQKCIEYYRQFRKKNQCLFIGMGDYTECFSRRENAALSNPDIHESSITRFDNEGMETVDDFYKDISFMGNDLVGLVEGNHRWEFSDGSTSTMKLCEKMGCLYLAGGLYGKLKLTEKNQTRHTIDIYAAHGSGNTITIGGSINKVERFSGAIKANIYLIGHDHQLISAEVPLMELGYSKDGKSVRTVEYRRCVIRSGSFMRVYTDKSKSYGIERLYKPTGIGNAQIEITFSENHDGDRYFTLSTQLKSW